MTPKGPRIRALVIDDEPLARRRVRTILSGRKDVEIVGEASSGTSAVIAIRDLRPDLLLLDIQMPGKDGFEVLQEIAPDIPITIFITAHDEHAVRAFDVQAIDYVLKPVTEERLLSALDRAIARFSERQRGPLESEVARLVAAVTAARAEDRLAIKSERGTRLLPVADIQWVEADADLVRIHTARGILTHRATMADMEAQLPAARFSRIHRSAIVNIGYIREIQPLFKGNYAVVLTTGAIIRSGRSYRHRVQAIIG